MKSIIGWTIALASRATPAETEKLAGELYDGYCKAVGGVAFNGDPLPQWAAFRRDESKQKQSDAWVATAQVAMRKLHP